MNFEFSDEMIMLGEQAERLFAARDARKTARAVLDGAPHRYDAALWREMASLGWMGVAIPEAYGGAGLGAQALCIIAEQIGRSLAAIPYATTLYLAAEAILLAGTEEQKQSLLPAIAAGERIMSFVDATTGARPGQVGRDGAIHADALLAPEGEIAGSLVLAALDADGETGLFLVDLSQAGVKRAPITTIDPTRNYGLLTLGHVAAERLGSGATTRATLDRLIANAMIPLAFEQVGGATACLTMARDYALERHAFGRPIGSFQAIKHKLARMFVANELARSNAYYGAWALSTNAPDLAEAAAIARLTAIDAYHFAARECLEVFGGLGFTWEADCHLYIRRAKLLASAFGGTVKWSEALMAQIESRYR
ncbi:acyl-CoA dehydrogenase [Sphingomonas sp. C8-2]|jgi:alkylation response protein AidB-like acyl-CoA dehydrogenase|nr:acyl-CoA dehydrogenase [Sphingomonas sp. C8-2]